MRGKALVEIPGQRHDDVFVVHNGAGTHRRGFTRTHLTRNDGEPSVFKVRSAGCGAGGKHQQLIVRLHVHRIIVQRAGTDFVDVAEKIGIGVESGAQIVETRPVSGVVVDQHNREYLIFIGVKQCFHCHGRRLAGVIAVDQKFVQIGEHRIVVHVVAVNDRHFIGGFSGFKIVAFVKKERTVLVVGFMEVMVEIIIVVPGIHDGVVDAQEVAVACLIGQPAAQILILGVQVLQRGLNAVFIQLIFQLVRHRDRVIGIVDAAQLVIFRLGNVRVDHQLVDDIAERADEHHQRQREHAFARDFHRTVSAAGNDVADQAQQHLFKRTLLHRFFRRRGLRRFGGRFLRGSRCRLHRGARSRGRQLRRSNRTARCGLLPWDDNCRMRRVSGMHTGGILAAGAVFFHDPQRFLLAVVRLFAGDVFFLVPVYHTVNPSFHTAWAEYPFQQAVRRSQTGPPADEPARVLTARGQGYAMLPVNPPAGARYRLRCCRGRN